MIGKKIKVNDYKFTYGQETVTINLYSAFKNTKSGNKYAIYSYNNNSKLFYGSFFQRKNEGIIMTSKENPEELIKEFINSILNEEKNDKFDIISLEDIDSVQIIDEHLIDFDFNINKLYDLTIPKPVIETHDVPKKKKTVSIAAIFFCLFVIVVIAFFFFNPEVIIGKKRKYSCTKNYLHSKLPASVSEEVSLVFNGKGNIVSIDLITDYMFNNTSYYKQFKDKGYFYQYMEEGDTYKFIDENFNYRLFSELDIAIDFFLPTEESELILYYEENNYICKAVEIDE